jgi:hypothetical protein
MSYIVLRGRWCDFSIVNVHTQTEDKIDRNWRFEGQFVQLHISYWLPWSVNTANVKTQKCAIEIQESKKRERKEAGWVYWFMRDNSVWIHDLNICDL